VNVGDEPNLLKLLFCIILIALVYLEFMKIYTGSKTVCVLKRLRNTDLTVWAQGQVKWAKVD